MINTITFEKETYPMFQASGFAARFAFPFALEVCKGKGYDIGYNRIGWKLPGAIGIDLRKKSCVLDRIEKEIKSPHSATKLPPGQVDYIFSSHMLEHLDKWVDVLDYWYKKLKQGGVLFLYLPDQSQKYWRPWNNRKHVSIFTPEIIQWYFESKFKKSFISGVDLNNSFMAMGEK